MSDTNLNDASFTPEINDSEESTNKQAYSATGSFRFWCQKVLPLVYDDSLSYYELLCKVVNYLNNVIQNVDNLNTSVDNTNTAFDNLQNYVNTTKDTLVEVYGELEQYVNDYFNNLDVQEEINAKLDVMASDGSLSELLSPFIPSLVSDWLSKNITPTSPAIDASLSISGAGADAKVTGEFVRTNSAELADIRVGTDGTIYPNAGDAVRAQITDLVTGKKTPAYLYRFADFKTDVTSWHGYDADDFTITNDAVTIREQHFIYKRHFFDYVANSNISVRVRLRIDSYAGGSNEQQLRITAGGYTGSDIIKDVFVDKDASYVVYDDVKYEIGDEITVAFDFENVAINNNAYIGFSNKNNPRVPAIEWSVVGFDVYYTLDDTVVKVKYAEQVIGKRYAGKTWGAVGDSLTAQYYDVYVSYVANATGLVATNYGIGGTTLTHIDGSNTSMVDRICGLNGQTGYADEFDLWTVFGGINDSYESVPLGAISDSTESTFYGALNLICQNLLGRTNHPRVALIAPYDARSTDESPYITAIVDIGKKYGIPVLNLQAVSQINYLTWSYYLRDVVHPTQAGANLLRPIILEWFEGLRMSETTPNMPH